ncbi:MAG: uracil-DNA glycosylase [Candidatus Sungbacteria bacterium]|nr:uracil-DNA glycosylase [Candidatus Sungbacteria bacterium]
MSKASELKALEEEIARDASLPLYGAANLVFGEGNPDADVVFIGEAPGFHEDRLSRPFVGTAGKLLDKLIAEIGWKRADVYITNIVKRRPPDNRDPLPEEIALYSPYLSRQIDILQPKAIVPLGRFAMNYFLPEAKITRDQGKVFLRDGKRIIPMFHPAAALRATAVLETLTESFKKLPKLVEGDVAPEPPPGAPKSDAPSPTQTLF